MYTWECVKHNKRLIIYSNTIKSLYVRVRFNYICLSANSIYIHNRVLGLLDVAIKCMFISFGPANTFTSLYCKLNNNFIYILQLKNCSLIITEWTLYLKPIIKFNSFILLIESKWLKLLSFDRTVITMFWNKQLRCFFIAVRSDTYWTNKAHTH